MSFKKVSDMISPATLFEKFSTHFAMFVYGNSKKINFTYFKADSTNNRAIIYKSCAKCSPWCRSNLTSLRIEYTHSLFSMYRNAKCKNTKWLFISYPFIIVIISYLVLIFWSLFTFRCAFYISVLSWDTNNGQITDITIT